MHVTNFKKNMSINNKGITLIALIVTILVLLILSGITITTLMGDNGIINKVTGAKQTTEQKGIEEQIKLAVVASMTNEKAVVQEHLLETALENSFGIGGFTLTGDSTEGWTISAKDVTYKVDLHGNKIEENSGTVPTSTDPTEPSGPTEPQETFYVFGLGTLNIPSPVDRPNTMDYL